MQCFKCGECGTSIDLMLKRKDENGKSVPMSRTAEHTLAVQFLARMGCGQSKDKKKYLCPVCWAVDNAPEVLQEVKNEDTKINKD